MKKLLMSIGLFSILSMPAFSAEKYATVNVEYVMSKYPEAIQATDWLRKEELNIQKFVLDAKKDIDKTPEAQRKAKEDKYNKDLQTKAMNLRNQQDAKGKVIFDKFDAAVKSVAKSGGYTLVVPAALYGATDISDSVLKELSK